MPYVTNPPPLAGRSWEHFPLTSRKAISCLVPTQAQHWSATEESPTNKPPCHSLSELRVWVAEEQEWRLFDPLAWHPCLHHGVAKQSSGCQLQTLHMLSAGLPWRPFSANKCNRPAPSRRALSNVLAKFRFVSCALRSKCV